MHFHPKMLEIPLGTDAEYDKAVVEYFFNYYQFIVDICKIAIKHRLVNQEIVGLCKSRSCCGLVTPMRSLSLGSMVALESLPMHLTLFHKLWIDLSESQEEAAKEFVNLLCTNCTNFRDYLSQILVHERVCLADDYAYTLVREFAPNVS